MVSTAPRYLIRALTHCSFPFFLVAPTPRSLAPLLWRSSARARFSVTVAKRRMTQADCVLAAPTEGELLAKLDPVLITAKEAKSLMAARFPLLG